MNRKNYEKMIAALESGRFQQARHMLFDGGIYLSTGTSFCCIGVGATACKAPKETITTTDAVKFLDIPQKAADALVVRNDRLHWGFPAIARYMRSHEKLFLG